MLRYYIQSACQRLALTRTFSCCYILVVLGLLSLYGCCNYCRVFGVGADGPCAEVYSIEAPIAEVRDALNLFMQVQPSLVPSKYIDHDGNVILCEQDSAFCEQGYRVGYPQKNRLFYYLYIADLNELYFFYICKNDDHTPVTTVFGLWAVCKGNDYRTLKEVNMDFSCAENRAKKKAFEEYILRPIVGIIDTARGSQMPKWKKWDW